jgi:Rap1a immunity proteins
VKHLLQGIPMTVHRPIFGMLIALMIGSAANAAHVARDGSVERLYGFCKSPDIKILDRCAAYIQGFGAMMYLVGQASADTDRTPDRRTTLAAFGLCHQGMVTTADMIRAFLNWTEQNRKDWDDNGEFGVLASLREAWPCK